MRLLVMSVDLKALGITSHSRPAVSDLAIEDKDTGRTWQMPGGCGGCPRIINVLPFEE